MNVLEALTVFELNKADFYIKPSSEKKQLVKKRYKKMILMYHPDKNKGDEECNKISIKINEAYKVLISEYSEDFSSEMFLINILKSYIETGDPDVDEKIKHYGFNLYNFFSNTVSHSQ